MRLRQFLLTVFFMWSHSAMAEWAVQGEENIFNSYWFRPRGNSFETSMTCNTSQSFSYNMRGCEYKCNANYCTTKCPMDDTNPPTQILDFKIEDCNSEQVWIYGDGLNLEINKSEYVRYNNTWFMILLRNFGNYVQPEGTIIFEDVLPAKIKKINESGQLVEQEILSIHFSIEFFPNTSRLNGEIAIDPTQNGLNQLIYLKEDRHVFLQQMSYILQK